MSPLKPSRVPSGTKRARSPSITEGSTSRTTSKRARPMAATPATQKTKTSDRERQEAEFRRKYKEALPTWLFHFDMTDITDEALVAKLKRRILELGGATDDFFSIDITHFICLDVDRPTKPAEELIEKENRNQKLTSGFSRALNALRKSPSKHSAAAAEIPDAASSVATSSLAKAREYEKTTKMKIWSIKKLDSVLSRCLQQPGFISDKPPSASQQSRSTANQPRSLTRLLQSEKLNGTTEQDPNQRRPDFRYFSKGNYFVLVEDMRQELATIAAQEYAPPKRNNPKIPWPVLHCHPQSRGPFVAFDDKERRRWEKSQLVEKECRREDEAYRRKKIQQFEEVLKMKEAQKELRRAGDLRRSASMNNLRRRASLEEYDVFDDGDRDSVYESANASGYLASGHGGYMAASGNSVNITSTTGTTSTTSGSALRRSKLPPNLQLFANREVVTSRKVTRPVAGEDGQEMGPPAAVAARTLRKSKSTNTIRLTKREEGSKPGYCECCRQKFNDFKLLDCVLSRVKRKTVEEVRRERTRDSVLFDEDDTQAGSDEDMYEFPDEL
ncbi:Cdc7p-Dbf4p kinase complex regulatory subunit [Marasmius crinis-equi]|uniref:Cdc7p-Dbf4p kinase complex regulatory subunit n=1 Tax=Marasmius crinis-equi TaxID=585013 RepID=A0ABR3FY89_9AGAR